MKWVIFEGVVRDVLVCALIWFRHGSGEEKGHRHKSRNGTVACGTSCVDVGKWQNPPRSVSLVAAFLQYTSKESVPPGIEAYWGQVALMLATAGGILWLGRR